MQFRRSKILQMAAISLTFWAVISGSVRAEEGELVAQDAEAQINLRSLASVQAEVVAAGKVGDRVQVLGTSKAKDGSAWYRVKVLRSGQLGWVRGDLIKVLGTSKTATAQKPATQKEATKIASKQHTTAPAKSTASVPLSPPKLSTARKAAASPSASPESAKPAVAAPTTENAAPPVQAVAAPSVVIVSFETPTYAVRVFSEAGHLRLNLFNRKSQQLALDAVPVESKNFGEATVYSYGRDLKVTIVVPTKGTPTLTTNALGSTLQEQPETVSVPAAQETAPK